MDEKLDYSYLTLSQDEPTVHRRIDLKEQHKVKMKWCEIVVIQKN